MKKPTLIYAGCVLLMLLAVLYFVLVKEQPQYLKLNIPVPQLWPNYSSEYAQSEELSTFVQNDSGHRYFVYRMYVSVILGNKEFETENDVRNYYDERIKELGWKEAPISLCNSPMKEFQPKESFRAYVYPTEYYVQPVACLATWLDPDGDGKILNVLIKTINPSNNVLSDWD